MGSAYVNHLDEQTGSIEVGKLADLAVIDRNLFEHPVDEIADAHVEQTFVEGERVFAAPRRMNARLPLHGPLASTLAVALVLRRDPERAGRCVSGLERPRGLIFRCRLVATDHGDDIALSFRLRTNESQGEWRIRLFHEGDRIVSKARVTSVAGDLNVRAHRARHAREGRRDRSGEASRHGCALRGCARVCEPTR